MHATDFQKINGPNPALNDAFGTLSSDIRNEKSFQGECCATLDYCLVEDCVKLLIAEAEICGHI
jgi:hypothetical protein